MIIRVRAKVDVTAAQVGEVFWDASLTEQAAFFNAITGVLPKLAIFEHTKELVESGSLSDESESFLIMIGQMTDLIRTERGEDDGN